MLFNSLTRVTRLHIISTKVGYIAGTNRRVVIANDVNLAEAYSLAKDGWITLWAEAILTSASEASPKGSKLCLSGTTDDLSATNLSDNGIQY